MHISGILLAQTGTDFVCEANPFDWRDSRGTFADDLMAGVQTEARDVGPSAGFVFSDEITGRRFIVHVMNTR